jgi:hypothetical protein
MSKKSPQLTSSYYRITFSAEVRNNDEKSVEIPRLLTRSQFLTFQLSAIAIITQVLHSELLLKVKLKQYICSART